MQLDKTRIGVRERGFLEILDLALRIIRAHLFPILFTAAIGIVPCAVLNHVLLAGWESRASDLDLDFEHEFLNGFLYLSCLILLVLVELPVATAPLTLYLGQVTFTESAQVRRIAVDFLKSLPQILVLQVLGRMLFLPWGITWLFSFILWPYVNEIILLERNPLFRRRRAGAASTLARISALHAPNYGDLFARAFASGMIAPAMVAGIGASMWMIHSLLVESWAFSHLGYVYLQIGMWVTVLFFTVVRFLCYLDLRIRNEGWELELRMRAEANRLSPQVTG